MRQTVKHLRRRPRRSGWADAVERYADDLAALFVLVFFVAMIICITLA